MKKNEQISSEEEGFFSFDDLPAGVELKKLGEIVSPSKEKIEPTADSTLPYVGLEHIESNTTRIIGHGIASDAKSTKTVFHAGDVLYGKLRPYLNKVAIPDFDGVCSTDILVFNKNPTIDNRYLMRYLSTGDVVEYANLKSKGISLPRVSFESLAEIPIPLPPLPKQQRIVTCVEALLTQVDAARKRLDRVPLVMKGFRQAVLAAACSGRLTEGWREKNPDVEPASILIEQIIKTHNSDSKAFGGKAGTPTDGVHDITDIEIPNSWTICELKYLSKPGKPITYGILKPGMDIPQGIPYVRVADFPNNNLNLKTIRRTTSEIASNYKRSILSTDDLIFSIRGTVGRICIVPQELNGGNITQDSVRISVHDLISRDYLKQYLQTPSVQKRFENAIKGVAIRGVNVGDVRVLQVIIPPLSEQHEIVRRVDALFARADAVEREVAAATRRTEALTRAVLAKAFRGELVTPGRAEGEA